MLPANTGITVGATKPGFEDTVLSYGLTNEPEQELTLPLSPELGEDNSRITLSWGPTPRDLDLHAYEQDRNNFTIECETYFE